MYYTAHRLAHRFIGLKEINGEKDNPQIMAMLKWDYRQGKPIFDEWPQHDEVPWCSAFVNYICALLEIPLSASLRARSWLRVGLPIDLDEAKPGFDIVILQRGRGKQPGPEVIKAPGHVGFYSGHDKNSVQILGGNQKDGVNISSYARSRILGVRRLYVDSDPFKTGGGF